MIRWGPEGNRKVGEAWVCPFPDPWSWDITVSLPFMLVMLRPLDRNLYHWLWLSGLWMTLLAFLGPQFADMGPLRLHNHMNQYLLSLSLYVYEKAMARHSSTSAWKIPWVEEPSRLQSMGLQSRTRLSSFTFTFSVCVCLSVYLSCIGSISLETF